MSDDPSGFSAYVSPRCNGPLPSDPKCDTAQSCGECPKIATGGDA